MTSTDTLTPAVEGEGNVKKTKGDVKKIAKKNDKDNPEIEVKMVGDVVKLLCGLCGYMGPSSQSVKSHGTKKQRRGVGEEEAKKRGELLKPQNDEKRPREDKESEDEYNDEDMFEGFDEDGNRIETVDNEEKVESADVEMEIDKKLPITEETVNILKQELETKKAKV